MDENTQPLSNAPLLEAIAQMEQQSTRENHEAVLDCILSTAQFLAPVTITPPPEMQQEGGTTLREGTSIQFELLTNQAGQAYFPAFTSWEQLRKLCGPKAQQTVLLTFQDYAGMILRDHRGAGFVVDPFGACLSFDRDMVTHLTQRPLPPTP